MATQPLSQMKDAETSSASSDQGLITRALIYNAHFQVCYSLIGQTENQLLSNLISTHDVNMIH